MEDDENYAMFYLKNREFSFEVDVSELYCGMNGAMYFTEMQANGGKGIGNNNAGAKYGTGYCDAQCPHDIKFIDGEANVIDWSPNPNDKSNNMGAGKYGACCAEMDIWEGKLSNHFDSRARCCLIVYYSVDSPSSFVYFQPIPWPARSPPTLAQRKSSTAARIQLSAVTMQAVIVTMGSATRMDAISTRTAWA